MTGWERLDIPAAQDWNHHSLHLGNSTVIMMPSKRRSIVFFHPDLGIGGAERLVIDAAVGLQDIGHKVTIFTSHCDSGHCFDEARDGSSSGAFDRDDMAAIQTDPT